MRSSSLMRARTLPRDSGAAILGRPMVRTPLRAAALFTLVLTGLASCSGTGIGAAGAGGSACGTCADVYINGGIVCGPSENSDAWQALAQCACGRGPCAAACSASFCTTKPADQTCGDCLAMSCTALENTCAAK